MKYYTTILLLFPLIFILGKSNTIPEISSKDWMSTLPDSISIRHLWIPGTHNSCTYKTSSSFSKCQTYDLKEQLNMGARYLDFRFVYRNNTLTMFHGYDNLQMTMEDALSEIKQFLEENPSEMILLRMQIEKKKKNISDDFYYDAIASTFEKAGLTLTDISNPDCNRLGNVRGKVIILEYIHLEQSSRTYPLMGDYSYWGYFSTDEQVNLKWNDILKKEIQAYNNQKFNKINLYGTGGRKLLGIPMPNPRSFTQLLVKNKWEDIVNLIKNNSDNFIVAVDFEELFTGIPGEFYRTVFEKNFRKSKCIN